MFKIKSTVLFLNICAALLPTVLQAESLPTSHTPVIGIIIDDLGDQYKKVQRVLRLPGAVACAFLPHTPFAKRLADEANAVDKEVMLHLPMQPIEMMHHTGPGTLTIDMEKSAFVETLKDNLLSIPHLSGVNNHMGSLVTQQPEQMNWLMNTLGEHGDLFFIDSRTYKDSIAYDVAQENQIPSLKRDIFLDDASDIESVREQFKLLIKRAHETGYAIGIGHPYESTITVLEEELIKLDEYGVKLVPIQLIISESEKRNQIWQAYLSR